MKCLWKVLFLLVCPVVGQAQTVPQREIDLDEFLLELFPVEGDVDEDAYESLFQFYRQPLNLNRADGNELRSLFILSQFQISSFLAHRETYGKLLSIYELQAIEGFDLLTIQKLLPFVTVKDEGTHATTDPLLDRILTEDNQFIFVRFSQTLEEQRGFQIPEFDEVGNRNRSRYEGSPGRWYMRYRSAHTGDFSVGFTAEKDAGEQFTWDREAKRYGFDFWSGHATFYNKGNFKTISVGDYNLQIGQGLLLAAGFAVGKGAESTAAVRRNTRGILPYTSVLETNFMRGAAATYSYKQFDLTAFYSNRNRDSTLLETGFYRSLNELEGKASVNEQVVGGHLQYESKNKSLQVGLTGFTTQFSDPLGNSRVNLQNQYNFRGDENTVIGADASYNWQNFSFFGEIGQSASGGVGVIGGFASSLSRTTELSIAIRDYDRDFHSFYGQAFGETSANRNENGIYLGLKIKPNKRWHFATYYDQFKFPWLRVGADAPSTGYEWLGRLTHRPTRQLTVYAQFRYESKEQNLSEELAIDILAPHVRRNYLLNLDYKASDVVSLKSRFQGSDYREGDGALTKGFVILQDVKFDIGYNLDLSARFALFDTDNFDNAQYVFEKNVLYAFSVPAYSGRGFRNYYLVRYKFSRKLDVWARYALTRFRARDEIGSGLDQIDGNTRSEVTVQVRVKF